MYTSLRLRSELTLDQLCDAFHHQSLVYSTLFPFEAGRDDSDCNNLNMAHHTRAKSSLQDYHSTASAPSLRAREAIEDMQRPFTPPDADAGNVKVVVRVRKFVKRGEMLHTLSRVSTKHPLTLSGRN